MTKKGTQDAKSSQVIYDTYSKKLKSTTVKSVGARATWTLSISEPENEETISGKKETMKGGMVQHRPIECHLKFLLQVSAVTSLALQIYHTWLQAPMFNPIVPSQFLKNSFAK